ncbi:MAG: endonuclease MutS2 [Synechococcaceae cyanobacterium SM2_3_1]|nr:endonuclease MutS2 [Synechococcaceae cyanobacterium SM2_3_1]
MLSETLNLLEWPRLCEHLATFTATKMGARACLDLSPWNSRSTTDRLLEQTAEAMRLEETLPGGLSLQGVHDLLPWIERAERGGSLQSLDLFQLATTLSTARKVRRTIDDHSQVPQLQDLIQTVRTYPELEQEILRCVEDDGSLRDAASEKLYQLRGSLREQRSQILDKLHRILSEHSQAVQEAVITQRDGRYVIPVKASHRDLIRGLVHDSSSSGATLYLEPYRVSESQNRLRQLQAQATREEERIRQELSQQVAAVAPDLRHLQSVLVEMDLALARCRYSYWLEGNRPQFTSTGVSLRQVRHPLLLWQAHHEHQGDVIPVDFRIQSSVRVVVITGPNTGGKTVALKTLGLLALMAKVGLFLPARDPVELPWFARILADIGDEQSLQQNLSTFSGHIRRIGRILAALPADLDPQSPSLVLLDEVGAGTDPTEGVALATALLQELAAKSTLTLATTHYGELKALKYENSQFENASVEFDDATLAPTYRLLWGIPGRSNALSIAERLDLAPAVVDRARHLLLGRTDEVNTVIQGLERQRADLETRTAQVETLHQELQTLQQQMMQRSQLLAQREKQLQGEKQAAIQAEIQAARKQVASVIRQLQKGTPSGQDAQQASEALHRLAPQQASPPAIETEFVPEVGDRVRLRGLDQTGEVIAIDGRDVTVRSGVLKFSVNLGQVAPLDEHQAKQRQRPKAVPAPPPPPKAPLQIRTSRNTVDLRGCTVSDAEILLEQVFAEADPGPLWIIHGHGTGRLRTGVQTYLKAHPRIQSFEAAETQDGGSGVTVATLS